MRLAILTAFAAPLIASAATDDGNEPDLPLLRGAGALIASDAQDTVPSFGIPEFLAQPKYCSKSCYRDCSCYSSSNDCYPKCCTKSKGNCPNGHMPPCEPPNDNRNPPKWDKDDPNSCPSGGNNDDDDDDNGNRDTRCDDNSDCSSSEFCMLSDCRSNASGRCTKGGSKNISCDRSLDKVCGCDQRTYDNECLAKSYGMSIDSNNKCNNNIRDQGDLGSTCTSNSDCNNGYYCKPLFGECSLRNRDGICTWIPRNKDDCKDVPNDQVCACNGSTEKNECRAELISEGVRSYGSCSGNDDDDDDDDNGNRDTRCSKSSDCSSSQYCKLANGNCGFSNNSEGRCTEGGRGRKSCNKKLDPVCGCDEREYDNECEAEKYGVSVDYKGTCRKSGRTQSDFDGTCSKNSDCRSGYYCKPLFGLCSTSKRDGFCVKYPQDRDDCQKYNEELVCGCDRVTEINECRAEYERVGVDYRGSCKNEDEE